MFNWFNMKKKTLPQQVLENTKDIEKLYDQELSDITQLNYKQDAEDSLTYADGKATFKGKMSIIRNENTQNLVVDSEIEVNISSGDDDIIIDAGEDNVSLKIRLDNATRNKINRALLTPITTPSEREFVAIGTNNSQVMIPESEINNKINRKQILYNCDDYIFIGESILTTKEQYYDLFSEQKEKNYKCLLGNLVTNNFQALVGVPPINSNYCDCYIRMVCEGYVSGIGRIFEILSFANYGSEIAKCYMFKNLDGEVNITDWNKI